MALRKLLFCFALALSPIAHAKSPIQRSHIDGNVPDAKDFNEFLRRDLLAYFQVSGSSDADALKVQLLRDAPTQTGISYPKYYAWVRVRVGVMQIKQGAVRLVAIDKARFEVTDFVSAAQIKADLRSVENVFPSALVPGILERAALP